MLGYPDIMHLSGVYLSSNARLFVFAIGEDSKDRDHERFPTGFPEAEADESFSTGGVVFGPEFSED